MQPLDPTLWSRLSPLLDELLECQGEARTLRLTQLCRGHPELAGCLRALLAHEAANEHDRFLDDGVPRPETGDGRAGRRVGAYTLVRTLGSGGMGSVWLAQRSDGRFDGQAAVKLPHPALLAGGGAERFAREARLLGRLAHPNIAALLDAGVTAEGQPYLILEHVEGEPIDDWCDRRRAGVEERLHLFLAVLGAVEHAHQRLVLHRDLKPGNILVTADGRAKLLDFGIAKLLQHEGQPSAQAQPTAALFTPDHAAPEQVQGGELTTATDVYALGVLLYELLSGRHPTARAEQSRLERMRAVVETEAPRLSLTAARAPEDVVQRRALTAPRALRRLRGDLDNILAKALKKAPGERYPTAAAMADDLRRHLDGQAVGATPDSAAYRTGKFVARHRLGVGAASATLLMLLAGVAATTWQAVEARRERDEARYQSERAQSRSKLFQLLLGAMGSADRPLTQRQILEGATRLVESSYGHDPVVAAELLLPIAGQYNTLGEVDQDLALMRRAAQFAAASGDPNTVATIACNTVDTQVLGGHLDQAQAELDAGLQALDRSPHPRLSAQAECADAEATLARARGDTARALERLSRAIELSARAGGSASGASAGMIGTLAVLLQDNGDLPAALAAYERVLALEQTAGRTLAQLATQRNAATVLIDMGEIAAARVLIDQVLAHWPAPTAADPVPAYLQLTDGMLRLRLGEPEAAARALAGARATAQAQSEPRFVILGEYFQAQLALQEGRLDEAAQLLQAVHSSPLHLSSHYLTQTPAALQALLLAARGATAAATQQIDAELHRLDAIATQDGRARAATLRTAARIALGAGDPARAAAHAEAAVAAAQRLARDASKSADVGEAWLLLASAQQALGQHDQALASARRALPSLLAGLSDAHPLTRQAQALIGG